MKSAVKMLAAVVCINMVMSPLSGGRRKKRYRSQTSMGLHRSNSPDWHAEKENLQNWANRADSPNWRQDSVKKELANTQFRSDIVHQKTIEKPHARKPLSPVDIPRKFVCKVFDSLVPAEFISHVDYDHPLQLLTDEDCDLYYDELKAFSNPLDRYICFLSRTLTDLAHYMDFYTKAHTLRWVRTHYPDVIANPAKLACISKTIQTTFTPSSIRNSLSILLYLPYHSRAQKNNLSKSLTGFLAEYKTALSTKLEENETYLVQRLETLTCFKQLCEYDNAALCGISKTNSSQADTASKLHKLSPELRRYFLDVTTQLIRWIEFVCAEINLEIKVEEIERNMCRFLRNI